MGKMKDGVSMTKDLILHDIKIFEDFLTFKKNRFTLSVMFVSLLTNEDI